MTEKFNYIKVISEFGEVNRPPGGKKALKKMLNLIGVQKGDRGLDVGCNTGFCTLEVARIKQAKMDGVDISEDMIRSAKKILSKETASIKNLVTYTKADATSLPYDDDTFDFVFSGGSTVFVNDIQKALKEYARVVKPWGFVGELVFFYRDDFPTEIVNEVNDKLGISIKKWDLESWIETYKKSGLELFEYETFPTTTISDESKISDYVLKMLMQYNGTEKEYLDKNSDKLIDLYKLFNKNNKYLDCGIFILRKRETPEEPFLFDA